MHHQYLGPTVAHFLTALVHADQNVVVDAMFRHGLTVQESTILIQTFRIADPTDRRERLKNPLATVRPESSPVISARLMDLEQRLEALSRVLIDFRELHIPDDLPPAELRRIEAIHRRVSRDVLETARQLEEKGTSPGDDTAIPSTPNSGQPAQSPEFVEKKGSVKILQSPVYVLGKVSPGDLELDKTDVPSP